MCKRELRQIHEATGITPRTLNNIFDRAVQAGFEPMTSNGTIGRLDSSHVANAPKSGRPRKQEAFKEEVLAKVRRNRRSRERSFAQITIELEGRVSA